MKLFQHILHPFSPYTPTEADVYISCVIDLQNTFSEGLVSQSNIFKEGLVNTNNITLQSKVQL